MENRPPQSYPLPLRVSTPTRDKLPDLDGIVRAVASMRNTTRTKVARVMGRSQSGMVKLFQGRNPRVAMLVALCEALQFNFFDTYMRQLPEHLRSTTESRLLQEQLEQMQAEKDALQLKLEVTEREREVFLSLLQGQRK